MSKSIMKAKFIGGFRQEAWSAPTSAEAWAKIPKTIIEKIRYRGLVDGVTFCLIAGYGGQGPVLELTDVIMESPTKDGFEYVYNSRMVLVGHTFACVGVMPKDVMGSEVNKA